MRMRGSLCPMPGGRGRNVSHRSPSLKANFSSAATVEASDRAKDLLIRFSTPLRDTMALPVTLESYGSGNSSRRRFAGVLGRSLQTMGKAV
jgi:hypothetical protein